jgi:hypothetical protein
MNHIPPTLHENYFLRRPYQLKIDLTAIENKKSTKPKKAARIAEINTTAPVDLTVSFKEGHVTRLLSTSTSLKKSTALFKYSLGFSIMIPSQSRAGGNRTPNRWIWSPVLYQIELLPFRTSYM